MKKRPPEKIRLSLPLRNVRPAPSNCLAEAGQRAREQECYERGRREGEQALSEQLLQQRNELLELQQGVLDSLRQAVPQVIRESEQALVALALEVSSKLVAGLPISGEMVEVAIREALSKVEQSSEFTVLLHADDLALLQKINSPLVSLAEGVERIRFRSSGEVTRGGCLVQTKFGRIDGRREAKLEALEKSLLA